MPPSSTAKNPFPKPSNYQLTQKGDITDSRRQACDKSVMSPFFTSHAVSATMQVSYYDNGDTEPDSEGWLDIERIYCLDWEAFGPEDMSRLREIFDVLPESRLHDEHDCHWWYSTRYDVAAGYLTAGVEPPGLQVFGTLPAQKWKAWDLAFRTLATDLPARENLA